MQTGDISEKIERGKHTTRHSQLIQINSNSYLFDTPGFSSLEVSEYEPDEITGAFPEFHPYQNSCKFKGCAHIHEPSCGVKEALRLKQISELRYDDYVRMYTECKNKRRY